LAGGVVAAADKDLAKYELKQAADAIWYRRWAFALAVVVCVGGYSAFLCFVFRQSWYEIGHERLILATIFATVPTIVLLALIRYAFAEKGKASERDDMSIVLAFIREVVDAVKGVVKK
jgi:hypothetical protein